MCIEAQCPRCGLYVQEEEITRSWSGICRACRGETWLWRTLAALSIGIIFTIVFAGSARADAKQDFQRYANTLSNKAVAAIVVTRKFRVREQLGSSEVLIRAGNIKLYRVVLSDREKWDTDEQWQQVVRHELCHLYVHEQLGFTPRNPHGTHFEQCALRLGVSRRGYNH